jgi:hypothetical protein
LIDISADFHRLAEPPSPLLAAVVRATLPVFGIAGPIRTSKDWICRADGLISCFRPPPRTTPEVDGLCGAVDGVFGVFGVTDPTDIDSSVPAAEGEFGNRSIG